jgi:uncharacterized protein
MVSHYLYTEFGSWLKSQFPFKIQKISVNAGFTCPNRDGNIGIGGCTYCNNQTFNPEYCDNKKSISSQLKSGKLFFSKKYPEMKYLAYFQAYTNTYGDIKMLKSMYEEALAEKDIVGIVIGTRPDCVTDELLDYLEELNSKTFLIMEYGIESANDLTLKRINRGHDFECSINAIEKTKNRRIITGGHIILGLPGEDENESIRQASIISNLKLDILKIHQLQIIKGTKMATEYQVHPFHLYTADEYVNLITKYIQYLRRDLVLERFVSQSPKKLLIAPDWGLKNYEFTNKLRNQLINNHIYQGMMCDKL